MTHYLLHIKSYLLLVLLSFPVFALAESGTLSNPLIFGNEDGENGVAELITAIVGMLQIIAIPIVVFFIIYAGFLYVTARGNPEVTKKANKALTYAVIGAVIVLGAQAIGMIVQDTATGFNTE